MRQDFEIEQGNDGLFDMTIDPDTKDFGTVEGMETAVDMQLFIDRRITKQDTPDPSRRKGWIGDLETAPDGYLMGSLLHLKSQSRDTPDDKAEVAGYAKLALDYFVAIRAAKRVTAVVIGQNVEGQIYVDDNRINQYNRLWRGTNATRA